VGRGASIQVGEQVTLVLNRKRVRARIQEDRGRLGPGGQRVLRLRLEDSGDELELSEQIFDRLLDPPAPGGSQLYVRREGSDTWHWCRNCSNYPSPGIAQSENLSSGQRPSSGELCNQCLGKERSGSCSV
jgi:hypothetical protein